MSLIKLELSTQQKQTAHKTDRFVENDVQYEQNSQRRFAQYDTEVDIRFTQTRTYNNSSSGPANNHEEYPNKTMVLEMVR